MSLIKFNINPFPGLSGPGPPSLHLHAPGRTRAPQTDDRWGAL